MFLDFFLFELKLRFKSISTYVYFTMWFLLAFFSVSAQDFGPIGAGKMLLNGSYATLQYFVQLTAFGMIVMAAMFGPSILRDFSATPTRWSSLSPSPSWPTLEAAGPAPSLSRCLFSPDCHWAKSSAPSRPGPTTPHRVKIPKVPPLK